MEFVYNKSKIVLVQLRAKKRKNFIIIDIIFVFNKGPNLLDCRLKKVCTGICRQYTCALLCIPKYISLYLINVCDIVDSIDLVIL
jgi:hypothetical protein